MVSATDVEVHGLLVPQVVLHGVQVVEKGAVAMIPRALVVQLVLPLDFLVQMIGPVQCVAI